MDDLHRYRPNAAAWDDLTAAAGAAGRAPIARCFLGSAAAAGRVYMFGGQTGGSTSPGVCAWCIYVCCVSIFGKHPAARRG